jgi:adenylate kinase
VERIIGDAIAHVPKEELVVLDGFPRTDSNVRWMERELPKLERRLRLVVLINLDIETSLKRLRQRGRADDSEAAIKAKFRLFDEVTRPVVEHYRELGLLAEVDGRGTIDEVHEDIVAVLEKEALIS